MLIWANFRIFSLLKRIKRPPTGQCALEKHQNVQVCFILIFVAVKKITSRMYAYGSALALIEKKRCVNKTKLCKSAMADGLPLPNPVTQS